MNFEKLPEPDPLPPRPRRRGGLQLAAALGLLGVAGGAGWWLWHVRVAARGDVPAHGPSKAEADSGRGRAGEASSMQAWKEVEALDVRAREHLRRREIYQAQSLIGEAWAAAEKAARQAPAADAADEARRLRLQFLNHRQADLRRIQDLAYDRVQVSSGDAMVIEVGPADELFRRVVGAAAGPEDAETFARRLGWVLGRETMLLSAPAADRLRVELDKTAAKN